MGQTQDTTDWAGMRTSIEGAAGKQLQNNRLNTSSPFARQTFNPDGSTSTELNGGLGAAAGGLMGQAGDMARPMDWDQFGNLGNGDDARNQAIDAAYGQATARLDPQWDDRMERERTRLLNQGLSEDSAAFKGSMRDTNFARNDAYGSAMNSAISQGTAAGDSVFRNNLMSRTQMISEALKKRGMPVEEISKLQSLLTQPGYNTDNSTMSGALGSAGIAQQAAAQKQRQAEADAQSAAGTAGGIMSGVGTAAAIAAMFF